MQIVDREGVMAIRRRNLKLLVDKAGGASPLSRLLGYMGPSYVSQMLSGHRDITERAASTMEEKLALASGWMERPHEAITEPSKPTYEGPCMAAVAVYYAMDTQGFYLTPSQFRDLSALVQRDAVGRGYIDEGFVNDLLKIAAAS